MEIKHYFAQRNVEFEHHLSTMVTDVLLQAAPFYAQTDNAAHSFLRAQNTRTNVRLPYFLNLSRVRHRRGISHRQDGALSQFHLVDNGRRGRD